LKTIKGLISKEKKVTPSSSYYKYTYLVGNTENHDEHEATAIQKYEIGESVRTWFDDKYNTTKLGKLCQKCNKKIMKGQEIRHEWCEQPDR